MLGSSMEPSSRSEMYSLMISLSFSPVERGMSRLFPRTPRFERDGALFLQFINIQYIPRQMNVKGENTLFL